MAYKKAHIRAIIQAIARNSEDEAELRTRIENSPVHLELRFLNFERCSEGETGCPLKNGKQVKFHAETHKGKIIIND